MGESSRESSPHRRPPSTPVSPQLPQRHRQKHGFLFYMKSRLSRKSTSSHTDVRDPGDSTDYAADRDSSGPSSTTVSPLHRPKDDDDCRSLRGRGSERRQGRAKRRTSWRQLHFSDSLDVSNPPGTSAGETEAHSSLPYEEDLDMRQRENRLRGVPFFQLRIHLKQGVDLVAKDACGTSDPYVKFKVSGRLMHKSKIIYKDLNPLWDEVFTLPIEDAFQPVYLKVFDYDWGLQDDFMGAATIDLSQLELSKSSDLTLKLTDPSKPDDYLGRITLNVTLAPKTQEEKEQYFSKDSRTENTKKLKNQIWSSVVTIVLVEGKNLLPMDPDGTSDPYVKFRLGNEKFKCKPAMKTLNPRWLEQFDFHMYDDQTSQLDVQVFDHDTRTKDDFMGRASVDLKKLEREVTHNLWVELEDGAGLVFLLLTISGTTSESVTDLASCPDNPRELANLRRRYSILRSFHNLRDVGHLTVKVYKAQGLVAADLGGKSDPFCVLELVNARLQTQTEYRTLEPSWQKIFTFNVKDVHSLLEVSVFDEDRDNKVDFLGRVNIPLLSVRNGEKKWYALKDKHLRVRAKGASPQILLEISLIYNPIRACIRTLNPREEKYMQSGPRFKRAVFTRNFQRIKAFTPTIIETGRFVQSCFEWESPLRSMIAFIVFLVTTYCFELYMLPLVLLLVFLKNHLVICLLGARQNDDDLEESEDDDDDDDRDKKKKDKDKEEEEEHKPEEKKSLKERLQAIQEITATVQTILGYIASLLESSVNTFNFTVPFLSWLAIFLLTAGVFLLYLIPVRYLIMAWGTNKFTKKLIRPNAIPNNELLDFLSRVPDTVALAETRELKLTTEADRRRDQKRKKTS